MMGKKRLFRRQKSTAGGCGPFPDDSKRKEFQNLSWLSGIFFAFQLKLSDSWQGL